MKVCTRRFKGYITNE